MPELIDQNNPAVGIQFSVGLSALGSTTTQLKQALTRTENTLSLSHAFIAEKELWVGAYPFELIQQVPVNLKAFERIFIITLSILLISIQAIR